MPAEWMAPLAAFLVCWVLLFWLLRRVKNLPMDRPNERSLHETPMPRIGGLGIMAGIGAAAVWLAGTGLLQATLPVTVAAFALAAVSVLDDVRGLPVALRFLAHCIAAVACPLALGFDGWGLLAGTLAVVWMTNLYNFMDGADGLAGGMAAVGFGTLAATAWVGGTPGLAAFCASIAAAAVAFLCFNFPPARLFMGDAGSIPLGFLAAVIGILGVQRGIWAWSFPLLVFLPFVADASVTLVRRVLKRENISQAHRSHYYQRVVMMGATHRQLAWAAYALMLAMAALAFAQHLRPEYSNGSILTAVLLQLAVFLGIDYRWRQFQR